MQELFFLSLFSRPAVRKLSSIGKFTEARGQHSDDVFFLYIGDNDEQDDLFVSIHFVFFYSSVSCVCFFFCNVTNIFLC